MSHPPPPSSVVSATRYLHLAPSYALAPPTLPFPSSTLPSSTASSSSAPAPPFPQPSSSSKTRSSSSRPTPTGSLRPYDDTEIKQLVLEYLCHQGFIDSAKAFARQLADKDKDTDGEVEGLRDEAQHGTNGRARHDDAMEGVEATPEPFLDGEGEGREPAEKRSSTIAGNGKVVAFDDEVAGGDEDDEDCGVLSKEDVQDVRLRKTIQDAVLQGRITHAVDLLNEHYPSVLASPSSSSFAPPPKLVLPSRKSTPCTPSTFFVATPPPGNALPPSSSSSSTPFASRPPTPSYIPITGSTFGAWALSLSPDILSLNLQTQAFIEHMRAAHASSTGVSAPSTPTSSILNGHTPRAAAGVAAPHLGGGDENGSDAGMSASTGSLSGSTSLLNIAIAQSQALREKVLRLPLGKEREGWEKESIDVCGLLAYKDLASCPVRGYLAQGRREVLAEMVNAAIMQQTSRTPLPVLALAARQTTAFWTLLREMGTQFPPTVANGSAKDRDSNNGKNKAAKTLPSFDLHTYLEERDAPPSSSSSTSAPAAAGGPQPPGPPGLPRGFVMNSADRVPLASHAQAGMAE